MEPVHPTSPGGGRHAPGDVVALREFHGDRLWEARPARVVQDEPDDLRFFVPSGTRPMRAVDGEGARVRLPGADRALAPGEPGRGQVLSFASESRPHAVLLIWDTDWRPRCWYLNLQLPLRRTSTGFDTTDLFLDLVGSPDRSEWRWKDEDDLAEAIGARLVDRNTAVRIRAEAEALAERIGDARAPFDADLWDWRPEPAWVPPLDLPEGWDRR